MGTLQILKIHCGIKFGQKFLVPILYVHIAKMATIGMLKPHVSTSD